MSKTNEKAVAKKVVEEMRELVSKYGATDGRPIYLLLPLKDNSFSPCIRILDTDGVSFDEDGVAINPNTRKGQRQISNLEAGACMVIRNLLNIKVPGLEDDELSEDERVANDEFAYDVLCTMLAAVLAGERVDDVLNLLDSETFSDFVDDTISKAGEGEDDDDDDDGSVAMGMLHLSRNDARKVLSKLFDPDTTPEELKKLLKDFEKKNKKAE